MFETFTHLSIKIILILINLYDECHIYKPLMSRESNSEKYLICKNFNDKHTDVFIKGIE
jgi:hypothetical protein